MYKNILVGVDGSEPSDKALKEAANFAKETGAKLHVFHAVSHHYQLPALPLPFIPQNTPTLPQERQVDPEVLQKFYEDAGKAIIAHAEKAVTDLKLGIDEQVDFHLELDISPEDFAVDFAKKQKADLIIVGCKGHHSRARRVLLGTVASKIVNEAPCQVLVVR